MSCHLLRGLWRALATVAGRGAGIPLWAPLRTLLSECEWLESSPWQSRPQLRGVDAHLHRLRRLRRLPLPLRAPPRWNVSACCLRLKWLRSQEVALPAGLSRGSAGAQQGHSRGFRKQGSGYGTKVWWADMHLKLVLPHSPALHHVAVMQKQLRTARKGGVLAMEAVKAQGKGSVVPCSASPPSRPAWLGPAPVPWPFLPPEKRFRSARRPPAATAARPTARRPSPAPTPQPGCNNLG